MREPRQEVALADSVEAELGVEPARPVVGERLEEDHVVSAACLVERVLDDRSAEPTAAVRPHRFDVLDLGGPAVAADLAVRGDAVVHDRCEEARRDSPHDQPLRIVQLPGDLVVAPGLRDRRCDADRLDPVELHLPHHGGVDASVRFASMGEHDVRRAHVPTIGEGGRRGVPALLEDHAAMVAVLHDAIRLRRKLAGIDVRLLDRHVVGVVDARHRVGEEADTVRRRHAPLRGGELDGPAEVVDALDAHRRILAVRALRASVRGSAVRGRRGPARARGHTRPSLRRADRGGAAALPGRRAGSGSCRARAGP